MQDIYKLVGRKITTDTQLTGAGKKIFGNDYIGTYASDEANNIVNPTGTQKYCIINNKPRGNGGEHWVAICMNKDGTYIFDSFGRPTKDLLPALHNQLKQNGQNIYDADYDADQKIQELDCGARSLGWMLLCKNYGVEAALLL